MKKFVEEKLGIISDVGDYVGRFVRKIFGTTSKGIVALVILLVFGFAVFVWGVIDGMRKRGKNGETI
jgi:hypothetical protein